MLRVLWLLAGAAMLLLVLFLAVLFVAGCGFRLLRLRGEEGPRSRAHLVFTAASAVVLMPTLLILTASPLHSILASDECDSPATNRPLESLGPPAVAEAAPVVADGHAGIGIAGGKARTLVLYDPRGDQSGQEETSAQELANLVSHFGAWTAQPVTSYQANEMAGFTALIYLSAAAPQQLPSALLDDVLSSAIPVMWIGENVRQLQDRNPAIWSGRYGFAWRDVQTASVAAVEYKGTALPRDPANSFGLTRVSVDDPARVSVLAAAIRADGSALPWAVRSSNVTYVAESPFRYTSLGDRYLAFSDLLFDVLAPDAPQRHRSLLRLEDIGPTADPAKLREIAKYLYGQHIPFSFGVYPVYRDPKGAEHRGMDTTIRLADRPAVAKAIKYMISCHGTMVLHGYTHQLGAKSNPYDAVSANDFEFYTAHLDSQDYVQLDGPVPGDSEASALERIDRSIAELHAVGLPTPQMFEFPHYAASPADYQAVAARFPYRYERSLYFPGAFSGAPPDDAQRDWQYFPYAVRDIYGSDVIPENMDYFIAKSYNHNERHNVADLVETARRNLVVRDGTASFFYHPALGLGELPHIVQGVRRLGYTFVSPRDLVASS